MHVLIRILPAVVLILSALPVPLAAETIFACFQENRGSLRYVEGPDACKPKERLVSWQDGSAVADAVHALDSRLEDLAMAVESIESRLRCISSDSTGFDFVIEGCDLHVRDGSGGTDSTSGLGNLVIGYDEGFGSKNGTHNLVVGEGHEYTSYGGIVAGRDNSIDAPYANVLGGTKVRANSESGWAIGSIAQDDDGVAIDNDEAVTVRSSRGRIVIDAATGMEMESGGALKLSGFNVDMESGDRLSLFGTAIDMNSRGPLELSGARVDVSGTASVDVDGGILRLNDGSRPVSGIGDTVSPNGLVTTGSPTVLVP